jgi:hypothetical protein
MKAYKDFNIFSHWGNANQNDPDSTLHQAEWLRSKTQVTADAWRRCGEIGTFSIAGGIASWYSHSENLSGCSSENWT